ncbi:MAG: hypothetical protein AABY80_02210 [Candidatus Deferrimicrobiota bacterium]
MTVLNAKAAAPGLEPPRRGRPAGRGSSLPRGHAAAANELSPEAKRRLTAVLSVLGAEMTAKQAAASLEVTVNRYYMLESRAFEGMCWSLENRARGAFRRPSREVERLLQENDRHRREVDRLRALLRAAQRTMGLMAALPQKGKRAEEKGGGRRSRRATARALRWKKEIEQSPAAAEPLGVVGTTAPAPAVSSVSPGGTHG